MGDRALVVFYDKCAISPTVYPHLHGGNVPELLRELAEYMKGRYDDAEYAAARFTGLCHQRIPGNRSLGIELNSLCRADLDDTSVLEAISHGNAGLVLVNTADFTWNAYGGYLAGRCSAPAATLALVKPSNPKD
jgi:hypothetical protein